MSQITSMSFEPFFITALLGILIVIYNQRRPWRTRSVIDLIIFASLIFAVGWRCVVSTASSRYWSILIFPVFYYTVIFCWAKFWGKAVSLFIILLLVIFCIGKFLRFNPNSRFILNAVQVIEKDAIKHKSPLIIDCNSIISSRIRYYTSLPMVSDDFSVEYLKRELQALRGLYDVAYLILDLPEERNFCTESLLRELHGRLLFEQFNDRHNKKKCYVYCFPVAEVPHPLSVGYCFANGGFEEIWNRGDTPNAPIAWYCTEGPGTQVKIKTTTDAIHGVRSLFMQNYGPVTLRPKDRIRLRQNGKLVFSVKNAKNSQISAWMNIYDTKTKNQQIERLFTLTVNTNGVHQFQIPLPHDVHQQNKEFDIHWSIVSPDGMILDEVGFSPEKANQANKTDKKTLQ